MHIAEISDEAKSNYAIAQQKLVDSILNEEFDIDNRATLGPMIPIRLFQVLRLIALGAGMEEMIGSGAPALINQSGRSLGQVLGDAVNPNRDKDLDCFVGEIGQLCKRLSIGILVPTKVDMSAGEISLRVDECVSCAGVQGVSAPICHFEAGMVGGIIRSFSGRNVRAIETKCNAVGDKTCLIEAQLA